MKKNDHVATSDAWAMPGTSQMVLSPSQIPPELILRTTYTTVWKRWRLELGLAPRRGPCSEQRGCTGVGREGVVQGLTCLKPCLQSRRTDPGQIKSCWWGFWEEQTAQGDHSCCHWGKVLHAWGKGEGARVEVNSKVVQRAVVGDRVWKAGWKETNTSGQFARIWGFRRNE